ncbi:MAG: hypothetical protein WCA35_01515, partial [Kovacikia sp.]
MHSTHDNTAVGVWIPQLQQVLQQEITQVSQQISALRDLQVQCAIEGETLLITAELGSPIALAPQKILWALEQLVMDCGVGSTPLSAEGHSVSANSLSEPLPIQLCLILAGRVHTHQCHSFTLLLTGSVFDSSSTHPFLPTPETESIPVEFLSLPTNDEAAVDQED